MAKVPAHVPPPLSAVPPPQSRHTWSVTTQSRRARVSSRPCRLCFTQGVRIRNRLSRAIPRSGHPPTRRSGGQGGNSRPYLRLFAVGDDQAGASEGRSVRLFESIVRDAQGSADLAAFRARILEALRDELGANSGTFMDPPHTRLLPGAASKRIGMLAVEPSFRALYVRHKARYERSADRLVQAMQSGPVIDTDVYSLAERERLDLYAEVLRPQGTRSMLCAIVRHRSRPISQVVLKRHGRGPSFQRRDVDALAALLPALALADAGFQHTPGIEPLGGDVGAPCVAPRPLAAREAEVAVLVCKGMHNREIAMLLGTSYETVKKQVHNVLAKMEVSNRAELAGVVAGLSSADWRSSARCDAPPDIIQAGMLDRRRSAM